jgi:hypothetical protein
VAPQAQRTTRNDLSIRDHQNVELTPINHHSIISFPIGSILHLHLHTCFAHQSSANKISKTRSSRQHKLLLQRHTQIHKHQRNPITNMPRFRSFVQNRLARETSNKGGSTSSSRLQSPSLERRLGIPRHHKDKNALKSHVSQPANEKFVKDTMQPKSEDLHPASTEMIGLNEKRGPPPTQQSERNEASKAILTGKFEISESRDDDADDLDDNDAALDVEVAIDKEIRENLSLPECVIKTLTDDDDSVTDIDEPIETIEDESTVMTFQETFSSSLVLDSNLAILRSKEEVQQNDEPEIAVTFSATSADTEVSDLGLLARFFRLFHCTAEGSFEYKDEEDSLLKKSVANSAMDGIHGASQANNLRRFYIAGDNAEEKGDTIPNTEEEKPHNNQSACESISSAFSSPSRRGRRTIRPKSPANDEEVDCMIEITASEQPEEENASSYLVAELQSHQNTSGDCEKNDRAEEHDAYLSLNNAPAPIFKAVVSTVPWTGRASPLVLRDPQTMLPDNLPPMARLRYCSHIGGKYSLLVTEGRCYV